MSLLLRPGLEPIPGYLLGEPLGRGGCGEVWQATGPGGFQVALKFVSLVGRVGTTELRALEVIKNIRHPHLLANHGSWQDRGRLIIAMELADRTLMDRLEEAVDQGLSGIPAPEIFEYFVEAAKGLDFLNEPRHPKEEGGLQGIQHRDIKPQNLLLVGGSVKVADFGLAKVLENSKTGGHSGSMTYSYAPPEAYQHRIAQQSDQYSLAITYCHLRGGRLPFRGGREALELGHLQLPPDLSMLPAAERPAVARALAKTPEDRWPSCRAFIQAVMAAEEIIESVTDAEGMEVPPTLVPGDSSWNRSTLPDEQSRGPDHKLNPPSQPAHSGPGPRKRWASKRAAWALAAVVLLIAAIVLFPRGKPADAVASNGSGRVGPDSKSRGEIGRPADGINKTAPTTSIPADPAKTPESLATASGRSGKEAMAIGALIDRGFRFIASENGDQALSEFDEAIRLDPSNADAHAGRAFAYGCDPVRDDSKKKRGLGEADEAIRLDPKSALAHAARGNLLLRPPSSDFSGSLADCDKALELNPNLALGYAVRASVYLSRHEPGDHDQAIDSAGTAIRLDPRLARAYYSRGMAQKSKGELDGAMKDFTRAIEINPRSTTSLVNRATIWQARDDHRRAIKDLDEAIKIAPNFILAYDIRAISFRATGKAALAKSDHDRAAQLRSEKTR